MLERRLERIGNVLRTGRVSPPGFHVYPASCESLAGLCPATKEITRTHSNEARWPRECRNARQGGILSTLTRKPVEKGVGVLRPEEWRYSFQPCSQPFLRLPFCVLCVRLPFLRLPSQPASVLCVIVVKSQRVRRSPARFFLLI